MRIPLPFRAAPLALCCLLFAACLAPADALAAEVIKPRLSIPIPGVTFSDITITNSPEGVRTLDVPFLADYISGIYKYAVGVASVIAAVMMMVGGFQYLTAGGDANRVSAGKEKITNALVGLFLSLGTYLILFTINPDLVSLRALQIRTVKQEPYVAPEESEADSVNGTVATQFKVPKGDNIQGGGRSTVPADLTDKVERAALALKTQNYGMSIASSFRSVEDQIRLIKLNCQNPPGSATCNPKPGRPQTCILKDNNPSNCPHTTGRALDIWATKKAGSSYVQCVDQKQCIANKSGCFGDPCQAALIQAMRQQGFCVLGSEPWHFEQPKMSGGCT